MEGDLRLTPGVTQAPRHSENVLDGPRRPEVQASDQGQSGGGGSDRHSPVPFPGQQTQALQGGLMAKAEAVGRTGAPKEDGECGWQATQGEMCPQASADAPGAWEAPGWQEAASGLGCWARLPVSSPSRQRRCQSLCNVYRNPALQEPTVSLGSFNACSVSMPAGVIKGVAGRLRPGWSPGHGALFSSAP